MDIHREGKFFIGSDPQGRTVVGIDSQLLLIPLAQDRWILGAEEQATNSSHMLHIVF